MHTEVRFSRKSDILLLIVFVLLCACFIYLFATYFGKSIEPLSKQIYSTIIISEFLKTTIEISILIFGFIKRKAILNWIVSRLRARDFKGTGENFDHIEKRVRGIVIPVSRREQPEWIIRHLRPECVAFLYTELSKDDALELTREFASDVKFYHTARQIEEMIDMIKNPDDPLESKNLSKKFIQWFKNEGIDEKNIFIDTTGGKVPMSIGAFQAAEEMNVSSIYIIGKDKGKITNPAIKEQGEPIFLSNNTD